MKMTKPTDPRYRIDFSRSVYVYRNLHKACWSIKQDGLVKAHADTVRLSDCEFRVGEKGRLRVIKEKKKNVHAGVVGFIPNDSFAGPSLQACDSITYNPYKYKTFVYKKDEAPIHKAQFVYLGEKGLLAK